MTVERAHLVAGFGRIHWIEGRDLVFAGDTRVPRRGGAAKSCRHMNAGPPAMRSPITRGDLLGRGRDGWRMTGIDPEGLDLRCGGETARLDFAAPVLTPEAARAALVELARKARK